MLPGLDIIAGAGFLMLASSNQAPAIRCAMTKAPVINVHPITRQIEYDFSKTSAQLTSMGRDTVSPYAPAADTVTGGLTVDMPQTKLEARFGGMAYPGDVACAWYDTVTITIELRPKIYIARENTRNTVCRDAILEHERKHVAVNREIFNDYARSVGLAVQKAVNEAGPLGPFNEDRMEETKNVLMEHVKSAITAGELQLRKKISEKQGQIDSYEEYERVSAICR